MARGRELLADLSRALGVAADEATEDGRVTLEETPCAYRCPLAPLAEVDGAWLGRARAGQVVSLLEE